MLPKWAWLRHGALILFLFLNIFCWSLTEVASPVTEVLKMAEKTAEDILRELRLYSVFIFAISLLIVYVNLYILIKYLFFRHKYLLYFISVVVLSVIYFWLTYISYWHFFRNYKELVMPLDFTFTDFLQQTITPLAFLGATTGIKIFKQWMKDSERLAALQHTGLQNELSHLKNQVNPHFLFNTLNNIRTLNEVDVKRANQVLLGLSDILRYQIYDSNKETILLAKDIAILDDYLLLEKIRRDNFSYEIVIEGDTNSKMIPPLLFINFVENAIKHGASAREGSFCKLHFILTETQLQFSCINSKPSVVVKSGGGLGLKNVERRLELLYPNKHTLRLQDETNLYTVQLTIPV